MTTGSESEWRLVRTWEDRYFEVFQVGNRYKHPYGRTVTVADNVWLTNLMRNLNPINFNYVSGRHRGRLLNWIEGIGTTTDVKP